MYIHVPHQLQKSTEKFRIYKNLNAHFAHQGFSLFAHQKYEHITAFLHEVCSTYLTGKGPSIFNISQQIFLSYVLFEMKIMTRSNIFLKGPVYWFFL